MQLKANPFVVFERDDSPLSLHARRRWMNAGSKENAKRRRAIDAILRTQCDDGSFSHSVTQTITSLFELSLLDASPDRRTEAAINFLLECSFPPSRLICGGVYDGMFFRVPSADRDAMRKLRNMPFTSGCGGFVKTGAALYLATAFGQGDRNRIDAAYDRIDTVARLRKGRLCSGPCQNNILQACCVAPNRRAADGATLTAAALQRLQLENGTWTYRVPFFPTLMALGQLTTPAAKKQVDRALAFAAKSQTSSGAWGHHTPSFNAYAFLTAAESRGIRVTW